MKTIKIFVILLITLLGVSLIFNKPGVGNLENFYKAKTSFRYSPAMHFTLDKILKAFPPDQTIPLFSNQKAWTASKFLIFAFYFLSWISFLYLRKTKKKIFKISLLELSFIYFLSAPILLSSLALSFFEILAVPLFICAIAFLLNKRYFLFFVLYFFSVFFSSVLIIFLPLIIFYILGPKKPILYSTAILVGLFIILSGSSLTTKISSEVFSYPWLINQPINYISTNITFGKILLNPVLGFIIISAFLALFFVYLFLKLIRLGKAFPLFIAGTGVFLFIFTKSMVVFILFFSAIIYFLSLQKLFLKGNLNFAGLTNSFFVLFLIFSAFSPNLQIGNLILLPIFSLLTYMISPSRVNLTQLFASNLLVFMNFFVFFGTAGKPPVTGNFFELAKSTLAILYLAFCLKNIQKSLSVNIEKKYFIWLKRFLVIYLIVINFGLITSQGSPDMISWGQYAKASIDFPNPFKAQTVIDQRYPPISTVIIGVFANLWNYLVGFPTALPGYNNVPYEFAFSTKISVLVFYFISLWAMLKFSKSNLTNTLVILGTFSLIVQTQGLADVNIHAIPFLIVAILFLFKSKYLLSGLFTGIAISIKWQPVILIPVFLLTIFDLKQKLSLSFKKMVRFLAGLAIVPVIAWYLVFIQPGGSEAFERSFSYLKQGAPMLSGQALNLNWVVTYILHIVKPLENFSLEHLEGLNRQIPTVNAPLIFQGYLFYTAAFFILISYWLFSKKSPGNFLTTSLMIFFSHQILNKSAYEKHLFYSAVFMLLLFLVKSTRRNRLLLILLDIMVLINLGFFYGFTGPKDINRLFLGFDMTVLFSFYYLIIYFWIFKEYFREIFLPQQRQRRRISLLES